MKKITIRQIIEATGARPVVSDEMEEIIHKEVLHITQDSREVGEHSLFVAIKGERLDGNAFVEECFAKGAMACLATDVAIPPKGSVLLLVPDTKKALLQIALFYRKQFAIPFVALTGSVGKTTTKDMIASVLSQKFNTLATNGNYNNEIGVPLTLFRLEDYHEVAVIEMGMNHAGEIRVLSNVVQPDVALISNVGVAHIEYLGSREGILAAKTEIFDFMKKDGVAILNADNDMLQTLDGTLPFQTRWFGLAQQKDVYADQLEVIDLNRTKCIIHTELGEMEVTIALPGTHMIENALAAVTVGLTLGLSLEEIKAGLESFVMTKNRMDVQKLPSGMTILNDVYNANPVSMKASIDVLRLADTRTVAILGYMGELGEFAPSMHEEVGEYVAQAGIDVLIYIGKEAKSVATGAKAGGQKELYMYETQEAFWEAGLSHIRITDTILVKGSRSMALEKTVEKLQGVN